MTKPACARPGKWDRRIERARELADQYGFAAEILAFYAKLAAFQSACYGRFQSTSAYGLNGIRDRRLPTELNPLELAALIPQFRSFLSFVEHEGSPVLSGFARDLAERGSGAWTELLRQFWREDEREGEGFRRTEGGAAPQASEIREPEASKAALARFTALAFLRPYVEYLADCAHVASPVARRPVCPFCGSRPVAGVLRREGDGAKRSLVCSFCYTEWDYVRIACPACEESREERICVYTASQFEHMRLEACESCRTYLKTVDLTKNGLAVPEVDELAAIPLTLWADDKGYCKISRNIFGS